MVIMIQSFKINLDLSFICLGFLGFVYDHILYFQSTINMEKLRLFHHNKDLIHLFEVTIPSRLV